MSQAALNARERAAEKNAARRSNGSQLAGVIFLLMVLGTILWGGWVVIGWMKDANRLPLSKLVVTGERHYTTNDDIRQAILALGAPGTFMTQDVNIIQQQIERLPWIQQASVRKQWPDELKIHLVEYVPFARWNELHMIDEQGRSFSVPSERMGKQVLPLLYGPEGSERDVLEGYRAINKVLTANKYQLKMVAMSARHSWQLALDNDVRLELGRSDRMGRLQRFIELYPMLQQQPDKRVSYIDLRYDTGASVGWAPVFIDNQGGEPPINGQQNSNP
ncbi:cell division protein FtsQ [Yersinia pseudotuberculosis]|nr:protein FtsQ [Yersinia pseudotuberculosis]SUQ38270.1 cell division protein FtsQ [Yersinia pseudotuberculosis]